MAKDFYKALGVKRDASQADIQKAYRDLARKYHPDMNPDDPKASKKFQEIQDAFDVLNAPEKRQMYDQYGTVIPPGAQAGPGGPHGGPWAGAGGPGGVNMEDVDFSQMFEHFGGGQAGGQPGGQQGGGFGDIFEHIRRATGRGGRTSNAKEKRRGGDLESEVMVPFQTAITGGQVQIALQRNKGEPETIVVTIPPGIEDGKKIRLRGQGEPARGNGAAGDLLLTIHVAAHPFFSRKGNDLHVRLPITLGEAVSGGPVDVPSPNGTVTMKIPPGTSSGKMLRVKGQGVAVKGGAAGDLFAEVQIMLPPKLDDADRETIREIESRHPIHPRHSLRW